MILKNGKKTIVKSVIYFWMMIILKIKIRKQINKLPVLRKITALLQTIFIRLGYKFP